MTAETAQEIAALKKLATKELRRKYAEVFGDATNANNKTWLLKRIAWRLQANAESGTTGEENATVQLTLYQFQGQNQSFFNLLFMDIFLITIPPLVMFIFFNRQIVAGLTSGAVKG